MVQNIGTYNCLCTFSSILSRLKAKTYMAMNSSTVPQFAHLIVLTAVNDPRDIFNKLKIKINKINKYKMLIKSENAFIR